MGATAHLLTHGVDDGWMGVSQEHGAVPHPVVDIAVAINIPLMGPNTAVDVEREGIKARAIWVIPPGNASWASA